MVAESAHICVFLQYAIHRIIANFYENCIKQILVTRKEAIASINGWYYDILFVPSPLNKVVTIVIEVFFHTQPFITAFVIDGTDGQSFESIRISCPVIIPIITFDSIIIINNRIKIK